MRPGQRRAFAAVVAAALVGGVLAAGGAQADVTSVSGGAFGEQVKGPVKSGPLPSVTLPPDGGGPFEASAVGVNLPNVLRTGILNARTEGGNLGSHQGFAKSSASAADVVVGRNVVTAVAVASQCQSNGDGSTGSTTLTSAKVAGIAVAANPAPNTVINVPGIAKVVLNEQVKSNEPGSTSITVNALHVTLLGLTPALTQDVIVAQSRCGAAGPDVNSSTTTVKPTSSTGKPTSSSSSSTSTTKPPDAGCTSIFGSTVPGTVDSGDSASYELGVKFRSEVDGFVTGIRFYKSPANTGVHVGNLWTSDGTLLASVTFTGESDSGWQQANFTSPVPVVAGVTYVASYTDPNGRYAVDLNFFTSGGASCVPLLAPSSAEVGGNGVFGNPGTFPTMTFNDANYWVDVVFSTT